MIGEIKTVFWNHNEHLRKYIKPDWKYTVGEA